MDTEGFVLRAVVHPADIMDRDGVKLVLHAGVRTHFPRLQQVWVDAAYNGKGKGKDWIVAYLPAAQAAHIDWSTFLPPPGFRVLPRRSRGGKNVCLAEPAAPTEQGL